MNEQSGPVSDAAPKGRPLATALIRVYFRNPGDRPAPPTPTLDAIAAETEDGLAQAFGFAVSATAEWVDK